MGSTTVKVGRLAKTFEAVGLPDLQREPERNGLGALHPDDRRPHRRPGAAPCAPPAVHPVAGPARMDNPLADAPRRRARRAEMIGASRFPRHWVYDAAGELSHKSGLADFKDWYRKSFGRHTPWGDQDSKALVTAVESALERSSPNS